MSLNEISMFCQIEYFMERIRAARNIFVDAANAKKIAKTSWKRISKLKVKVWPSFGHFILVILLAIKNSEPK